MLSEEKTDWIAKQCLFCGNIDIYPAGFSDGKTCSRCGKHSSPIGYAKEKENTNGGLNVGYKMPVPKESEEQTNLFSWARMQSCKYPELRLLYHVPNGGSRHKIEAAHLRAEGVKPGVPDICLPVARGGFHGLYIEMKRQRGGRVSENQESWLSDLSAQGYKTAVCKGWQPAAEIIMQYLEG